ncbi:hypothetical protein GIY56_00615 [Paracoccus sp. YIM 132242]|uniref:Uncharacterized protein n=1 Tax=Paracoccus lichenicola TaxID=2665644 RepID=A0A6L6HI14_9RHOB|nr:hypothetical protein [Paracoccus lichenicola]MTD98785.1 hypothetical protein [Paracoccus lichenicola]
MTIDPFGGRIPASTQLPPYSNALTITPDDDTDLPVIPSALYIPASIPAVWNPDLPSSTNNPDQPGDVVTDSMGEIVDDAAGEPTEISNEFPWRWGGGARPNRIIMIAQNGNRLSIDVPSIVNLMAAPALILALRPRRILRTGTTLHRVTLLW